MKKSKNKIGEVVHVHEEKDYIFKMSFLHNLIYAFNAIPTNLPKSYFVNMDKLILKFIYRGKTSRINDTILKEN